MTKHKRTDPSRDSSPQAAPDADIADRAYRHLLQVRDMDNELMWTRSNIILLVQGGLLAILASKFETLAEEHYLVLAVLSLFGLTTAYFWWRITRGGSFWVDFWQGKLRSIEAQVTGTTEIFRSHPSKEEDPSKRAEFRRMGYVSTRKTLITVTLVTLVLWGVLFLYALLWPFMRGDTR